MRVVPRVVQEISKSAKSYLRYPKTGRKMRVVRKKWKVVQVSRYRLKAVASGDFGAYLKIRTEIKKKKMISG